MAQVANPKMCGHLRYVHITDGRLPISDFTVLFPVMLGICYPARWERALVSISLTKGVLQYFLLLFCIIPDSVILRIGRNTYTQGYKTSLYSTLII
jgi:hypothetical protein